MIRTAITRTLMVAFALFPSIFQTYEKCYRSFPSKEVSQINELTLVFNASVLLMIMNFVIAIVKVAVDPRGDSRVDPQNTLTML